ncbi:hypothetical protein GALL_11640 [mine drainage metagenome]|uniref:Glycosyltransferase RgtA/B/C/D-like domain-containing protein n=1 Tax=mine drainage metagenome TaxID=410659 RepID=A0A1J5U3D2_9ZZZZ
MDPASNRPSSREESRRAAASASLWPGMRSQSVRAMLLILVIGFVADFLLFNHFGIYEDDYLFTLIPANWSALHLYYNAVYAIQSWPQGRPGWWLINPTLTWLCAQTGTLGTFYLLLFAISSLSAFCIYRFLRVYVAFGPALCGALFFVLNPADASGAIIMHMTNYFIVLMMMLAGLRIYQGRYRTLSVLMAALVLVTYEPYFLLFGVFPIWDLLSKRGWSWKGLARYWAALAAVFVGVMLLRRHLGDDRASQMIASLGDVLHKAALAPWIGAWTNFHIDVSRPWDALTAGTPYTWAIVVISAAVLFLGVRPTERGREPGTPESDGLRREALLFVIGWIFVLVPYLYRWNEDYYPPVVTLGRLSAMHIPSGFGFSIVIASVLAAMSRAPRWLARIASFATVAYFSLLVAVGVQIQQTQMIRDWRLQKQFWQRVIDMTRDAGDGVTIIVDSDPPGGVPSEPRPTTEAFPASWMVSYSSVFFHSIFRYPASWKQPPAVYSSFLGMKTRTLPDGSVQLETPPWRTPAEWPVLKDGSFIWLEWEGMNFVRVTRPLTIGGRVLHPKPPGPPQQGIGTRPAYHLLFPAPERTWKSIADGLNYPP